MGRHSTGTTRAKAAIETREALINAASELFTAQGFVNTSLDAIAAHAGVTKGALYHHFDDKQALYLAAYEAAHERLATVVEEIATATYGHGHDRFEVFVDGCVAFIESVVTEPWIVTLTVSEGPAALGYERWRALDDDKAQATFTARLARMQARGEVRADVDVGIVTSLLNALVNEAAISIAASGDRLEAAARATPSIRAFIGALRPTNESSVSSAG